MGTLRRENKENNHTFGVDEKVLTLEGTDVRSEKNSLSSSVDNRAIEGWDQSHFPASMSP